MVTEKGVDRLVLGGDPACPGEHAETGENISGEPIVDESSASNDEEKLLARHVVLLELAVVFVEGIKQGTLYQRAGPDHARRPDEVLTDDSSPTVSEKLSGEYEENFVALRKLLEVEQLLHSCDESGIGVIEKKVRHNCDDSVFLHVEWTGVERPHVAKSVKLPGREDALEQFAHWKSNQLDDKWADSNGGPFK